MRGMLWIALLATTGCAHQAISQARLETLQNPNDSYAWARLGDAYSKGGKGKQAKQAYATSLAIDPYNSLAADEVNSHPPKELRKAQKYALKHPLDDEAWGDLGDVQLRYGKTVEASGSFRRAMTIDPTDGEWTQKIADSGETYELIALIDEVLPEKPGDDERYGDRADGYRMAGYTTEACDMYRTALSLDPSDGEWSSQVATCDASFVTSGDYPEEHIEEYAGILGMLSEAQVPDWSALSGDTGGLGMGGVEGGIGGLGGVGGYGYTSTKSSFDYGGYGLSYDPSPEEAAEAKLTEGKRDDAVNGLLLASQYSLSARKKWVLLTGKTESVLLQQLVEQLPEDVILWGSLGDALLAEGKRPEAITAWKKAMELDPSDATWSSRVTIAESAKKP